MYLVIIISETVRAYNGLFLYIFALHFFLNRTLMHGSTPIVSWEMLL